MMLAGEGARVSGERRHGGDTVMEENRPGSVGFLHCPASLGQDREKGRKGGDERPSVFRQGGFTGDEIEPAITEEFSWKGTR